MNEKEREVMQQTLEALDDAMQMLLPKAQSDKARRAAYALRAALAQEQAEPVGQILPNWSTEQECIVGTWAYLNNIGKNLPVGTKLYITPPQREQVLLTNEEIDALPWNGSPLQFARAVENASLEKNK